MNQRCFHICWAVCLLLQAFCATAAAATKGFEANSEMFMEVILSDSTLVNPAISTYPYRDEWYLPLGALTSSVDIAISVSTALGTAEGFIIDESNLFSLDTKKCQALVNGKEQKYECAFVVTTVDDIYVAKPLFEQWFPLSLEIDRLRSQITITAGAQLPIQARRERERLAERTKGLQMDYDPGYPREPVERSLLDGFFLDEQLNIAHRWTSGVGDTDIQHITQWGGELAGMESYAFLTGDQSRIANWRFSLSKRSPNRDIGGPLRLTEISLVDLIMPQLPLITDARPGRGLLFSSYPVNRPNTFESHDFTGSLSPGWEVLLYRNEVLIDRKLGDADGRYLFKSVPLLYGINRFRLSFFGPQGQRREEFKTINVDVNQLKAGEGNYRVGWGHLTDDRERFTVQASQNLARYLTVSTGAIHEPITARTYSYLGMAGITELFQFSANCAINNSGGRACDIGPQVGFGRVNTGIRYTRLYNFQSDLFNYQTTRTQVSQIAANVNTLLPVQPGISMTWEATNKTYLEGPDTTAVKNTVVTSVGSLYLTNELNYQPDQFETVFGRIEALRLLSRFRVRTALAYDLTRFTQLETEVQYVVDNVYSVGANIDYSLIGRESIIQLSATRLLPSFSVGLTASASTKQAYSIGSVLIFNLARDPRDGEVYMNRLPLTRLGAASVRVFIDYNANGTYEPWETPLPNMRVRVNDEQLGEATDERGIAFVPHLRPHLPADIAIDLQSLKEPFLRPVREGVRIYPRAGKTAQVDLPLVIVGEIDGTIRPSRRIEGIPLGGIEVERLSPTGEVVQRAKTDRDGGYLFENVTSDTYRIRIRPEHLKKLRAKSEPAEHTVTMGAEGSFETNRDFRLLPMIE